MIAPPRPPANDELEALIKEARERQLRRRLLGAAGVAIAAALGLSVYALMTGGNGQGATGNPSAGGVAVCRSSQLSGTAFWGGAAGSVLGAETIANTSTTPCSLPTGRPGVQIAWHNKPLSTRGLPPTADQFPNQPIRLLAPGAKAAVYMQWSNWCGRPKTGAVTTMTLLFRDGVRVVARHVVGQPPCANPAQPSMLRSSGPRRFN